MLSIGHSRGISNIIVPGSGEVNFDSYESNPYVNLKERQETEIKSLLNKLEAGMIGVDRQFVRVADDENASNQIFETANKIKSSKSSERKRARGRNRVSAKLRRKQKNVLDASTNKLKEKMDKQRFKVDDVQITESGNDKNEHDLLSRFITSSSGANIFNTESSRIAL